MERQREMHVQALNEKPSDKKRGTDRLANSDRDCNKVRGAQREQEKRGRDSHLRMKTESDWNRDRQGDIISQAGLARKLL